MKDFEFNGDYNIGPVGLAFDPDQNLVVVEYDNDLITVVNPQNGEIIRTIGSAGELNGQFKCPWGIAIDGEGTMVIADFGNNRTQVIARDGTFLHLLPQGEENEENDPMSAIIDREGNIIIADRKNHHLAVYG